MKLIKVARIITWVLFGICMFSGTIGFIMGLADPTEYGDELLIAGQGFVFVIGTIWLTLITLLLIAIAEGLAKFGNKISVEATLGGE